MKQILKQLTERKADYQPIPFWSWNDTLEPEKLRQQIQWMRENGIGGFFMHARGGLKTPYLSEEWMDCVDACCDEAEKQEMHAWVYDENGWPSGFVGGKLLQDVENRDMYILHKKGALDQEADISYLLGRDKLIRVGREGDTGEEYLNLYIKRSASTVDILNPKVVDQFLAETHEKYKANFGEDLSKKLKGFFTDEPQYYRWETPYTPMVRQYFQEVYGEELFDSLGLLFVEKEGYRGFRYKYWLAMQKLMLENFAKKVYTWCDDHGLKLTGHYVEEVTMGYQIMCCGGVMPFYEYEHIPGIDWLGRDTDNELAPRQVGSVARQLGKKHVLTETFGCCGWDVTPGELRRIAGFQYANGANQICHHLIPYSERGQRKRDYPAHFHPMNPWIKESFKEFNDYFSRLGYLLATGEEVINVAMLHPIRSAYFDYKRGDGETETEFAIRELDEALHNACRVFSSRAIGYHFLDETLLEKYGYVRGKELGCGECSYQYLILPKIFTMGKHTEKLLREFIQNGGKVLLLDEKPEYLEGELYDYSYLKSNCTLEEIKEAQPFQVNNEETEIYCTYRRIGKKPFLFVQNGSGTKSYTQEFQFRDNSQSFTTLDPVTFQMGKRSLTVTLPENGALLLFPSTDAVLEEELNEYSLQFDRAEVLFDKNYLTIDTVRYSKDGRTYSEPILRHRLFKQLLQERYQGKLWVQYEFDVRYMPEQLMLMAETENAREFRVNGSPVAFTEVHEDEPGWQMADITERVRIGKNVYEAVFDWYQSEATYYALFGENVTESLENCIAYESELEAIYLTGHFGVYSEDGFEEYDNQTVCAHQFYIGEAPTWLSEPTMEGLTFFRGTLTMRQKVKFETPNIMLRIEGRYLTAKVSVNGKMAGYLLFERALDISSYATVGENEIEVEFLIGNRNFLGPFHCAWPETFVSPRLYGLCNLPDNKDGHARYRFYRFYENSREHKNNKQYS